MYEIMSIFISPGCYLVEMPWAPVLRAAIVRHRMQPRGLFNAFRKTIPMTFGIIVVEIRNLREGKSRPTVNSQNMVLCEVMYSGTVVCGGIKKPRFYFSFMSNSFFLLRHLAFGSMTDLCLIVMVFLGALSTITTSIFVVRNR